MNNTRQSTIQLALRKIISWSGKFVERYGIGTRALLAQITDRTICHGTAGVFQTAWRAAQDATTPAIAAQLPRLHTLLSGTSSGGGATESTAEGDLIDTAGNLGLLNGAAGIGLALHTATTDAPPSSRWDTCLLIA